MGILALLGRSLNLVDGSDGCRGLIFIAYSGSIPNHFRFIQKSACHGLQLRGGLLVTHTSRIVTGWANNVSFPICKEPIVPGFDPYHRAARRGRGKRALHDGRAPEQHERVVPAAYRLGRPKGWGIRTSSHRLSSLHFGARSCWRDGDHEQIHGLY